MSRRRSTGDLVPKDITEILAREGKAQRGQRKPGSSLGQAFNWLRRSRRKKNIGNGVNRTPSGVTHAKPGLQNHDDVKPAGPKGHEDQKRLTVHYTASQHYQENVFIEGSRPQYLEDLHTEAQEGLKIQQQEEHKNGVILPDDETIASTDTLHPELDISSKDRGSPLESTIGNTNTTVLVSDRPVLTRQGSTFKPLNPVKRLDRSRKRSRRTTIMGIPNQVQKELALHRSSTCQPLVSAELNDHDEHDGDSQLGVVIIPTVDGGTPVASKEGARVHLSEVEMFRDEPLVRKHLQLQFAYHDEDSISSHVCPTSSLRPKSLAIPGMTTSFSISPSVFNFLQEPQGPVMSISPQATYLSTIIPNAVLPASVEVIEIDRSASRTRGSSVNHGSSVRTVSKSSLTSGDSSVSPLLSRRSDGDSSQGKNDSFLMPSSATGSSWSESQSSKTIVSNSSPPLCKKDGHTVQDNQAEEPGVEQDLASPRSSVSVNSSKEENAAEARLECDATESMATGKHVKNKRNCTRNLSVVKTKQPPAPPRRTNSLHGNKIRGDSRVVVDIKDICDSASGEVKTSTETVSEDGTKPFATNTCTIPTPASNSSSAESSSATVSPSPASSQLDDEATEPTQESRTSSPQKAPPEGGKFERTMSPSSGYSSQSGTPTLSPKEISPTSPHKDKKKPVKPERSVSRASSSASPSSSLTSLSSGTSELANPDISRNSPTLFPQGSSAAAKELILNINPSSLSAEVRELLNIPPPPKIKAPCPPPPETWVYNRRTVELLCGASPDVSKIAQEPAQTLNIIDNQTETRTEKQVIAENQTDTETCVSEISENKAKPDVKSAQESAPEQQVSEKAQAKEEVNVDEQREQSVRSVESQEMTPKKYPPPVMKKPTAVLHRRETEQPIETQQSKISISTAAEVHSPAKDIPSSQNAPIVVVETENDMDRNEVPSIQTLSIDVPKMSKISPPPTPPPAYHPTPPLLRKTPSSTVSTPPNALQKVQEELHVVDSCWPPPPPPLVGDMVFDGSDEVDFPPPPPLLIADSVTDKMNSCVTDLKLSEEQTEQNGDTAEAFPQPAMPDVNPMTDVLDLKAGEASFVVQKISPVPERLSPLPVEMSPVSPVMQAESPVSVAAVTPTNSFLKQNSLKIEDLSPCAPPAPIVPVATSPPTENVTHGVNFRRQPSGAYRDARSKELLSRHKSTPIPKEDANIPLVTPSLLQMVRLRSVSMSEDQIKALPTDKSTPEGAPVTETNLISTQEPQSVPQKPIRKSLSLKTSPQIVKTSSVTMSSPSMRLQEAIRIKTAAMSSRDSLPSRTGIRSPTYSCIGEPQSLKLLDGCDVHKFPSSTASFIFSRSTKKVVIETSSSPEAQAALKHSLVTELMQVSDQAAHAACSNGRMKFDKVPPPIARKPPTGNMSPSHNSHSYPAKTELGTQHVSSVALPETTTRITADTIETLF